MARIETITLNGEEERFTAKADDSFSCRAGWDKASGVYGEADEIDETGSDRDS
jgi:hypothetical protein